MTEDETEALVDQEEDRPALVDHVVLESDTLMGLCVKYGVRPRDLHKHNPSFDGRSLRGCEVLVVPWKRGRRQNATREVKLQMFRAATRLDVCTAEFYLDAARGDLDEAFAAKRRDDVFECTHNASGAPRVAVVSTSGVGLAVARRIACAWTANDFVYLLGTAEDVDKLADSARQHSHAQLGVCEHLSETIDVLVVDAELEDAARVLIDLLPDLRPGGRCVVVVPQPRYLDPVFVARVTSCYDMRSVASCVPADQDQNAVALVELVRAAALWARHDPPRDIFINACELHLNSQHDYWLDPNASDVMTLLGIDEQGPSNNTNNKGQQQAYKDCPPTGQLFRRNVQVQPSWRARQQGQPKPSSTKLLCPCTIFAPRRDALAYNAPIGHHGVVV